MRRGTNTPKEPTVFSNEFAENKDKATQWGAFKRRTAVGDNVEFSEAVKMVIIFLKPVYECIITEKEFFGHWKKDIREWVMK
jgi:hypothetical protein